ncbi:hypothetical protein [Actinomadura fulvescens]|uniref:hypothetical protein n=1 Tax=Actinomadura fulvescens TaxID=46160 RepID=UPI0031E20267
MAPQHGTDLLRRAADTLATVQTPYHHPARVIAAGRILVRVRNDPGAVYLGAHLQMIGERLRTRRPPTETDMHRIAQAYVLVVYISRGSLANAPSEDRLPCRQGVCISLNIVRGGRCEHDPRIDLTTLPQHLRHHPSLTPP